MSGMKEPLLIGIYGKARSGKDTAADYLAEHLHLSKYAFAEPLKQMLKSVFGDHFHEGDRERICPESGISYRKMMQLLGTQWGREQVNPDLWVNLVAKRWEWVKEGSPFETPVGTARNVSFGGQPLTRGMILSDVRFDSEANWVKSQGGVIIEITRQGTEEIGLPGHQSEAGISPGLTDVTVANCGDLPYLYSTLDALMRDFLTRK